MCVVYKFSCDLCDTDYVGYTSRHLFQRIAEHKYSAIGKHLQEEHRLQPSNLQDQFRVLKKCRTKFDCLIYGIKSHYNVLNVHSGKPGLLIKCNPIVTVNGKYTIFCTELISCGTNKHIPCTASSI